MSNTISYIPDVGKNLFVHCLGCGAERIEAFQCSCGKKFCRSCNPNSFRLDEFGDTLYVTCPNCGAETLFV